MSDYLLAVSAQLDAEPDVCPCGHRWSQHRVPDGCLAMATHWTETVSAESCRCLDCGRRFCWRD